MTEIVPKNAPESRVEDSGDKGPQVGDWYWITAKGYDDEVYEWLGCVVHVGSNYLEFDGPLHSPQRVHFDEFWHLCRPEPNAQEYIQGQREACQERVNSLMGRVRNITAQLAVSPVQGALPAGNETQALARHTGDIGEYKNALVKAKDDDLPKLFGEIKEASEELGCWMKADLIPLQAEAKSMKGAIGIIEDRIFNVELYSGLTEEVYQITDGDPAPMDAKLHLMQRRCYMDEECLADYQTGGMEFKTIKKFYQWLAKPKNRDRILPFPRCVVAFQVRRYDKERDFPSLASYINFIMNEKDRDKMTFLFMRNGDQLYVLRTAVEFDAQLFPDLDAQRLSEGQIYAKMFGNRVDELISDNERQGMIEDYEAREAEYKAELAAWKKADKETRGSKPWHHNYNRADEYEPFNKESVYYDDIKAKIESDIKKHNRIALIVQGLLDRSPVFHPHPPWQTWTAEGFAAALELVYDDSRALTDGDKPDFMAYWAACNESLEEGSVTIGQEHAFGAHEAEKEYERRTNRHGYSEYRPETYFPPGNPGPGKLAKVAKYQPRVGKVTYAWNRDRQELDRYGEPIRTTFTCEIAAVFNVSAYKPGDFKRFFNDPRTRADYLKWAPFLLEAEEYHAGNREVSDPVPPPPKTKEGSERARLAYHRRQTAKKFMGQTVRLTRDIETKGGQKYQKGQLATVAANDGGGKFTLEFNEGRVIRLETAYFELADVD